MNEDLILFKVKCPHRNSVGACSIKVNSVQCLNCPLGNEYREVIASDTEMWGKEVGNKIQQQTVKEIIKEVNKIIDDFVIPDINYAVSNGRTVKECTYLNMKLGYLKKRINKKLKQKWVKE